MNIKFNIKEDEYVTITKSANFGYTLQHFYPTYSPRTKELTTGSKSYFYPDLRSVSDKIVWLGLTGEGVQEVIDNMVFLSERIAATLEKME